FADEGTLNSWSLSIDSGEIFRTTDADGNYLFDNLAAGEYVVREELQPNYNQVPPAVPDITAATWNNSEWTVNVEAVDNFSDPVPDSHRNVKNVDFANYASPGSATGVLYLDADGNGVKAPGEHAIPGMPIYIDSNNNGTYDFHTVQDTVSSTA